jgi:hypothetical protein
VRREIHRALAEATDADADPDRRVWPRALATQLPDEEIAAGLNRSAARAQARGGLLAAAALLERAARLTPGPARQLEPLDRDLARETYLDALGAAILSLHSEHQQRGIGRSSLRT